MQNEHKSCKKNVMRTLERLSYLVHHLKDMKHDECPYVANIDLSQLDNLHEIISHISSNVRKEL